MIVAGFPSVTGGSGGGGGGGSGLVASAAPASLAKLGTTSSLTTNSTTVTASGGTAPYSYSKSADGSVTVGTPDLAFPHIFNFTKTGLAVGQVFTATGTCLVTDAALNTATVDIPLTFERTGA